MMLSHLPVERVKIYQLNFTKFIMQNFSFTKKQKTLRHRNMDLNLNFSVLKKDCFVSFCCVVLSFLSLFVWQMQIYYLGFTY